MNHPLRRQAILSGLLSLAIAAGCNSSSPKRSTDDGGQPDGGGSDQSMTDDTGAVDQTIADAGADASETGETIPHTATMFLPNSLSSTIYRYAITPTGDPQISGMLAADRGQGATLSPNGDLWVGDYSGLDQLYRVTQPLTMFTTATPITGLGLKFPQEMRFVDDELWVVNSADHACTNEAQSIVRIAFDADGKPSMVGTVQMNLIGANRGMLWVPATRDLFITQCAPVNTIQHFRVAADHSVTPLPAITGMGLANPHGMVMTSWGELLVVNDGSKNILRLAVDAAGAATATGTIEGNGLSAPVGLALTDWGELFVVNQGDGSISRFTFAADHSAVANGTFPTNTPTSAGQFGVGWIVLAPAAP